MSSRREYRAAAARRVRDMREHVFGSHARYERIGWLIGYGRYQRSRRLTPEEAALVPVWLELDHIRTVLRNHQERIERLEEALNLAPGASPQATAPGTFEEIFGPSKGCQAWSNSASK